MLTLGALFAVNAVCIDGLLVVIPAIATEFDVTQGQAQLTIVMYLLGYALAHIPSGLLGDRFGRRPVILCGLGLSSVFALLTVVATSYALLITARFGLGVSSAFVGLMGRAIIRDVTQGRAAASLTSKALSYLAVIIIVTPLLSGALLVILGWRAVMGMIFVYILSLGVLSFKQIPETFEISENRQSVMTQFLSSASAFFKSPQSIFASLLAGVCFGTYFIFSTIGASAIVDVFQLPAASFGAIFALVGAVQFFVARYNAKKVQHVGILPMLKFALVFTVLGLVLSAGELIAGSLNLYIFIAIGLAFAITHGTVLPNAIALTLDPLPRSAGFASSIQGMFQAAIATLVGFIVSSLYDGTSDRIILMFLIFGVLNLVAYMIFLKCSRLPSETSYKT